jgi:hypothetical protein
VAENSISSFINNKPNEPSAKKPRTSEQDPDDSLKFFKSFKLRTTRAGPSSVSNVATDFIDKPIKNAPNPRQNNISKKAIKTKSKAQPDIRKVLSKREQMLHQVIDENCVGVDPEEMQLALALSNSLKDNVNTDSEASNSSSMKFENPFSSAGKVQSISAVLEKFGFKCKTNYTEYELDLLANKKITKRSKYQKLPTTLTRTSNEKRQENIKKRIDSLLEKNSSNLSIREGSDSDLDFVVFSPGMQEYHEKNRRLFSINSEDRPTEDILFSYYVAELFEPSLVPAGHLLKDWSKIPGRDQTPERVIDSNGIAKNIQSENSEHDHQKCQEIITSIEVSNEIMSEEENFGFPKNDEDVSRASCSDIFAGFEDSDDELKEVKNATENNFDDLSQKLETLQEKLSESMSETKHIDKNISITLSEYEKLGCSKVDACGTKMHSDQSNSIDLTQCESSIDSNGTIPYDDSYYSLRTHLKKVLIEKSSSDKTKALEIADDSAEQIDLISTDEDEQVFEGFEDNRKSLVEESCEKEMSSQFSQNSLEDDGEFIAISDEEINYSVRKFHNENESLSDRSNELDEMKEQPIDAIQENHEIVENMSSQLEINNTLEQSLVDVMDNQDDIDINDTITNLLETTQLTAIDETQSRSKKDSERSWMTDSIKKIMSKYVSKSPVENTRSFRKMHSESQLSKLTFKESSHIIHQEDAEDMIDLTQPLEKNESIKENFNRSIHQSLENLSNYSPDVCRKKALIQEKSKKSLGIQIDENYHLDLDSIVLEPDFKNMTPVELKQTLFKYGIRSLPVKKAISLLEFIHNQIHPTIQAAAEEEIDANDSRREMNFTDIVTNIGVSDSDDFVVRVGILDDEEFILPKVRKSKVRE